MNFGGMNDYMLVGRHFAFFLLQSILEAADEGVLDEVVPELEGVVVSDWWRK